MLEPSISVIQAIVAFAILFIATLLTIALFKSNPKNRYPSKWAGFFCLTFVAWVAVNIIDDRTTNPELYLWFARLTYAIPYWVFVFFITFIVEFPPKWKNRTLQLFVLPAILLAITFSILNLLPQGLVLFYDYSIQNIVTKTELPYFYASQAGYLLLLLTCSIALAVKRKKMLPQDKRPMKIIGAAFIVTVVSSITFSALAAFNVFDFYAYYYSYLSVGIFFIFFAYVVLRFGVISTPVSFSKRALLSTITSIAIFATLGLLSFGLINLLDHKSAEAISFPQIVLGLLIGFTIQQIFERFWSRQLTHGSIQQAIKLDRNGFLRALKDKYQLSGIAWVNKFDAKPTYILGSVATTELVSKLNGNVTGLANPIDVQKNLMTRHQFATTSDAGPQRVSLVLPTTEGFFVLGHKRFNIAFSEDEILNLKRDISLHSAEQEIDRLQRARQNHIAEIESVTEETKNRLARANELIYRKLHRRAMFFRTIARELRTPLTVVSSIVQSGEVALPADAQRTILNATTKLVALSKEFEVTSGLEVVDEPLVAWLDLTTFAEQIKEQFSLKAKSKQIRIKTQATDKSAISIKRLHLEQIIDNLIGNAINYSPNGSEIVCDLEVSPGRVTIAVSDEGPGIPAEEQKLIFEPFYRATTSKNTKGSGLGLSTVLKLSQLYKGTCLVEQRIPKGSRFVVDMAVRTKLLA